MPWVAVERTVPGCSRKNLMRLPNHLAQVHRCDKTERASWLLKSSETQPEMIKSAITWNGSRSLEPLRDTWEMTSLLPFESCSSICVSGATCSGKTTFVYRLLKHLNGMFTGDSPSHILYCYGIYQPAFEDMEETLPNFTLHEGLPSTEELEEFTKERQHRLIILDDLYQEVLKNARMELLFTQGCHHRRISVIFITQNLFAQGKSARTIQLNTGYLVLFKNVRDASQVTTLARQLYPGNSAILMEAYQDCMKEPYGYLVIDLSAAGVEKYRLRTKVFPGELPVVYVPKSLYKSTQKA